MNSRIYEEINDPDKWSPRMGAPLNLFELARFQLGLNQIFGLAMDNSPNVRIVWGQDWEKTKRFNRYSGSWYPGYLSHVQEEDGLDENNVPVIKSQYVAAPRYVIEGKISQPENALALGECGVETLAMFDEDGKQQVISKETYQAAVGEEYEEILRIYDHDHIDPKQSACCQWNAKRNYECWGYYRHPDAGDLKYLAAKWREMQKLFQTGPDQQRTPQEKQYHFLATMAALTEQKRKQKEEIKKELGEFWKSNFAQLDQSAKEASWGPYHFVGEGMKHSSSGL